MQFIKVKSKNIKGFLFIITILSIMLFNIHNINAADIFKGGFTTGKLSYAITTGCNTNFATTAVKQWNGVSSKVKISKYKGKDPMSANLFLDFNRLKTPNAGLLGVTFLFANGKQVSTNKKWDRAICIQYINPKANTNNSKIKTCVHEIGHALGLSHPLAASNPAIMKQGISNRYTLYQVDKNNLISKWGR